MKRHKRATMQSVQPYERGLQWNNTFCRSEPHMTELRCLFLVVGILSDSMRRLQAGRLTRSVRLRGKYRAASAFISALVFFGPAVAPALAQCNLGGRQIVYSYSECYQGGCVSNSQKLSFAGNKVFEHFKDQLNARQDLDVGYVYELGKTVDALVDPANEQARKYEASRPKPFTQVQLVLEAAISQNVLRMVKRSAMREETFDGRIIDKRKSVFADGNSNCTPVTHIARMVSTVEIKVDAACEACDLIHVATDILQDTGFGFARHGQIAYRTCRFLQ